MLINQKQTAMWSLAIPLQIQNVQSEAFLFLTTNVMVSFSDMFREHRKKSYVRLLIF